MRAPAPLFVISALVIAAGIASAQPGPEFKLGFRALADQIPDIVGEPLGNEHHNPINGDGLQQTTRGLMVWRKADNWTAFTDGARTWVNGPNGIEQRGNEERLPWESQVQLVPLPIVTATPSSRLAATPVPTPSRPPDPRPTWVPPTPLPSPGPLISNRQMVLNDGANMLYVSMGPGRTGDNYGWAIELQEFPELTPGRRLAIKRNRLVCEGSGPSVRSPCSISAFVYQRVTEAYPGDGRMKAYTDIDSYFGSYSREVGSVRRVGYPHEWRAEPGGDYFAYFYRPISAHPLSPYGPFFQKPIELEITVEIYEW